MKRSKLNYWVDVSIGIALVVSAISGLVFLLPVGNSGVLGVSYRTWDSVHTLSSLAMIGGATAHLLLHWKWLVTMTKRMVTPQKVAGNRRATDGQGVLTRRRFLRLGLGAAAVTATIAAGFASVSESDEASGQDHAQAEVGENSGEPAGPDEASKAEEIGSADAGPDEAPQRDLTQAPQPDEAAARPPSEEAASPEPGEGKTPAQGQDSDLQQDSEDGPAGEASDAQSPDEGETSPPLQPSEEAASAQPELGVACLFGLVNDPFPGRCRRYTDNDSDGVCDHSILGSGSYQPKV